MGEECSERLPVSAQINSLSPGCSASPTRLGRHSPQLEIPSPLPVPPRCEACRPETDANTLFIEHSEVRSGAIAASLGGLMLSAILQAIYWGLTTVIVGTLQIGAGRIVPVTVAGALTWLAGILIAEDLMIRFKNATKQILTDAPRLQCVGIDTGQARHMRCLEANEAAEVVIDANMAAVVLGFFRPSVDPVYVAVGVFGVAMESSLMTTIALMKSHWVKPSEATVHRNPRLYNTRV
jgi:hypothetical protein